MRWLIAQFCSPMSETCTTHVSPKQSHVCGDDPNAHFSGRWSLENESKTLLLKVNGIWGKFQPIQRELEVDGRMASVESQA